MTMAKTAKEYWLKRAKKRIKARTLSRRIFSQLDPRRIATSLKNLALLNRRRKQNPYETALAALEIYLNRAGKSLPPKRRKILDRTKVELQKVFGRS